MDTMDTERASERGFEQRQPLAVIASPPYRVLSREPGTARETPAVARPAAVVTDAELEAEYEQRRRELEQLYAS